MIIFGWGFQTNKEVGVVFKYLCSHCNNEEYWVLTRTMTWFTLFFIPIFPYKIQYFFKCPICEYGRYLDRKQFNDLRPIAEANQLLINGEITEVEYHTLLNNSDKIIETKQDEKIQLSETVIAEPTGRKYCGGCGNKIIEDTKFCGHCGINTPSK